jgi:outer membrane protein assembly factor BamB
MAAKLRAVRAVPIALLSAIVVSALVARALRAPAPPARDTPLRVVGAREPNRPAAPVAGAASSLSSSLRGPTPPPKADVPSGAPRTIHGSARRTHRAAARGPSSARVGYRVVVDEGSPIAAQVAVSSDESTLYVATLGGRLVALARADGARRWAVALGDRAYATPLVHDDGTIYVGSDAKKLFAISPAGETVFRLDLEGEADSGAMLGKDGAVVFAAGRFVHATRRAGDVLWRFAARGKVFTSPALTEDGLVVFGSQDDHVYALGNGGALAWSVDQGADVDGAPAIGDDGAIYVGTDAGDVVRLDGKGAIVWRTPVGGYVRGALSIARSGDVLVGTYGPVPRVVRVGPDGSVRGAFAIPGTGAREFGIHGGPLEDAEGALYFGAQDDAVYAIGPDGAQRWRFQTGADVDAPLTMLSDGSLIVPSEDGTVTLLLP